MERTRRSGLLASPAIAKGGLTYRATARFPRRSMPRPEASQCIKWWQRRPALGRSTRRITWPALDRLPRNQRGSGGGPARVHWRSAYPVHAATPQRLTCKRGFTIETPYSNKVFPYIGVGAGVAFVSIKGLDSANPSEPGINHFNSDPDASDSAFAMQLKGKTPVSTVLSLTRKSRE